MDILRHLAIYVMMCMLLFSLARDVHSETYVPTEMIISDGITNHIIMIRNYDDLDRCRDDRSFIIQLGNQLENPIFVTCTPMGME